MAYWNISASTIINVPDFHSLQVAARFYQQTHALELISEFRVVRPLTDSQRKRLGRAVRSRLVEGSDRGEA